MSRDFSISKFSYKAFRDLKKRLGKFDAVAECNELAIREFEFQGKGNLNSYIKTLSDKHRVSVSSVDFPTFLSRIRQFYILSVMQQADQFLNELKKEYAELNNFDLTINQQKEGETDLSYILRIIFGSEATGIQAVGSQYFDTCEYYRLVRNKISHSETTKDRDIKLKKQYEIAVATKYKTAPNSYEEINFDDFLLISQSIKNIGYKICELKKPPNENIAKALDKQNLLSPLSKLKNNISESEEGKKRYEYALENLINSEFGRFNTEDINDIIQHIRNILDKKAEENRKTNKKKR